MAKKQIRARIHERSAKRPDRRPEVLSRPLDVHRWSDYPELRVCLADLVSQLGLLQKRSRARSRANANRFSDTVRTLILDLYVAWQSDPASAVGVALGKSSFARRTRYNALYLRYDTLVSALRGLLALGYAEKVLKGFHDPRTGIGRVTRIRATQKLIDLLTGPGALTLARLNHRPDAGEVIVLRDSKGDVEYRDNSTTREMRSDLNQINAALASHWLDLFITDSQMGDLNATMLGKHRKDETEPARLDLTAKRLRRIFNNKDWGQGGRFYGGWWQTIPKEYRAHITINGKHIVEIDYSGMHPSLLYAEAGAKLDSGVDPYDIGSLNVPRHIVKIAFNKLVNASKGTRATPDFDGQQFGISWSQLVKLIRLRHEPIAQFLGTGHGLRLQNKDAKIANRIMLRFLSCGYVCLPVHDSFIVHHALKCELEKIMKDEFRAEVGTDIVAKTKFDVFSEGFPYKDDDPDMGDPLSFLRGKYAAYETRLIDWSTRN